LAGRRPLLRRNHRRSERRLWAVTAADLATPEALFGANQGLAALREILRQHGMRATFAEQQKIAISRGRP